MLNKLRYRLAIAVSLAASQATAQQSPALEEVAVFATPIKQSEAASIAKKQEALNVVDGISADTIGRFPDQNLADSLARIPGIAIERDQGQARYVNLRGAPFRYTAIGFDGIDVPGAENGRIPRFDSFPAVITRNLTVNKAVMANMPAEAVSGFINIETHSPFDTEGLGLALDLGLGEQDLGGGDVERAAMRASYSTENFGIIGFYSSNSREQITDNREFDFGLDAGTIVPNEVDFRSYQIKRSDEAYGGTIEYRGEGPISRVYLTTLYSEFTDEEERTQYVFEFLAPQPGLTADNAPLSITRLLQDGTYENSTFTNTLGADFNVAGFEVKAAYNYTETEFKVDIPIIFQTAGFAGLDPSSGPIPFFGSYDFSNQTDPLLTVTSPLAPGGAADIDSALFLANLSLPVFQPLDQEVNKFKLDVGRDYNNDNRVDFGLQYDQREAIGGTSSLPVVPFPVDQVNVNSFDTNLPWDANTTNTINATYFDNPGLRNAWAETGQLPPNAVLPENQININEDILALYAMYTQRTNWGSWVAGLRYEQTDYENIGLDGFSYEDDYSFWLPNVHINYDISEQLKLRVSGSTGVNRPTYAEWRAAVAIDPTEQEISGGNPFLDAEESYGFDVSLEYYLESGGLLSAAAFYRFVDNVIYADTTQVDAGQFDPALSGQIYDYTTFLNGSDGEFSGIELNAVYFADRVLDGLGISANLTLADSQFQQQDGDTVSLPGTSDTIWNAAIFYENFGISARINYSWRDEWISPIEDPEEFWGEMERLDAQISYTLPFEWAGTETSIYASFNNLTDETDRRFAGNGTINQSESFGMHYLIGLRVNL